MKWVYGKGLLSATPEGKQPNGTIQVATTRHSRRMGHVGRRHTNLPKQRPRSFMAPRLKELFEASRTGVGP
jgi:hypothetical protein